jgi:hypothetical protein
MKAFQEITEWDSEFAVPNHVYFLNDGRDKMYGYVRESDGVVQTMRTPYRFHTRGRKFKEVKNVWNFGVDDAQNPCVVESIESWAVAKMSTLSPTMLEHGHAPAQPASGKRASANIL